MSTIQRLLDSFLRGRRRGRKLTVCPSPASTSQTLESRQLLAANIAGVVFDDANANGFQDPGENGLGGQIVFVDTNQNGKRDVFTKTYTASGLYETFYGGETAYATVGVDAENVPVTDVNVSVTADSNETISDFTIRVNHNGTTTTLFDNTRSGSSMSVVFDDEAGTSISNASSSPHGTYRPLSPLTSWDGTFVSGTWELRVRDDDGFFGALLSNHLTGFSVTISYAEPAVTTNASGQYFLVAPDTAPWIEDWAVGVGTVGYVPTNGVKGFFRVDNLDQTLEGVNFGVRPDGGTGNVTANLGTLQGALSIGPQGLPRNVAYKWYEFTLDRPAVFGNGVSLDFDRELGDLNLELYDADRNLLRAADNATGRKFLPFSSVIPDDYFPRTELLAAGTYFVKVSGFEQPSGVVEKRAPYQLLFVGPGPDQFEPSQSPAQAIDLATQATAVDGLRVIRSASLDQASDVDWYRLVSATPLTPGNNWFQLAYDETLGPLVLELYDATGTTLLARSNGRGDGQQIIDLAANAGTYLLKVTGFQGAVNPNYLLRACYPQASGDRFEAGVGNGTQATASPLGVLQGSGALDNLSISSTTDADWYSFTLLTTGTAADWIRILNNHSGGPLAATLVDPYGVSTPLTVEGEALQASLAYQSAGRYHLRVQRQSGAIIPSYQIRWHAPTHQGRDWLDLVGTSGNADLRTVRGLATWNNLSIDADHAPSDVLRFTLADRGTADDFVQIAFDDDLGDLELTVYTESGTIVGRSMTSQDVERVSLAGWDPGTYMIVVHGLAGTTSNPEYALTIHAPPASPAERFEANDSLTTATDLGELVGVRTWNRLTMSDDGLDYYKLKLTSQGAASDLVRIDFDPRFGQLQLALFDISGNSLVKTSLTAGNRQEMALTGLPAGDYVLVALGQFLGTTNPNYTLTLQGRPSQTYDDWAETIDGRANNNTLARATNLRMLRGAESWTNLALVGSSDQDYFKFTLAEQGVSGQRIALKFDMFHGDLKVELLNASGTVLKTSDSPTDLKTISLEGFDPGTYVVRVTGSGFTDAAPYSLQVLAPGGRRLRDAAEPNDVRSLATDLGIVEGRRTLGNDAAGPLSLDVAGDEDWYRFELLSTPVQGHFASLSFDSDEGDLSLELYDQSGTLIDSSTTYSDGERISLAGLASDFGEGTYYLRVTGAAQPAYRLDFHAPGRDGTEGVDPLYGVPEGFLPINIERGTFRLEGWIEQNDYDYYVFQLPADAVEGDAISLSLSHWQGDLQAELYALPENSTPVRSSNTTSDRERISLAGLRRLDANGDVINYVLIVSGVGSARNSYQVAFDTTPALTLDFTEEFEPVYEMGPVEGFYTLQDHLGHQSLSIHSASDVDQVSFSMTTAPQPSHFVQIAFNQFAGDLDLELTDASGNVLRRSTTAGSVERISLDGLPNRDADGDLIEYRTRVVGHNGATNASYTLSFSTPASIFSDWAEANNTAPQAKDLHAVEGDVTLNGLSLHQAGDVDYFRFQLAAPGITGSSLTLSSDVGYGTLSLALYDAAGTTLLADSQVYSGTQFLSLATLPAGTYVARVQALNGTSTVPQYALSFRAPQSRGDWSEDAGTRGDTRNTAYDLQTAQGDLAWHNLSLHAASDEDWFQFQLAADATAGHFAEITTDFQLGDLDIELYDGSGNRLNAATGGATSLDVERVSLEGLKASIGGVQQTYYVRVSGFKGATQPSYSLRINAPNTGLVGDAIDAAKTNNTRATATALKLEGGVESLGGLSIHNAADADYYSFKLPAAGILGSQVLLNFNSDQGNLDLELLNASGTVLASSSGLTDTEAVSLNGLSATATYYLKVSIPAGAAIKTQPDYTLTFVTPGAAKADRLEAPTANNSSTTATPLRDVEGRITIDDLSLHTAADVDWFSFDLTSYGTAADFIRAAADFTEGLLDVRLYSSTNTTTPLATSANGLAVQELSLQGRSAGTYYLRIASSNSKAVSSYSLAISTAARLEPDFAEGPVGNNNAGAAFELGNVAASSGRGLFEAALQNPLHPNAFPSSPLGADPVANFDVLMDIHKKLDSQYRPPISLLSDDGWKARNIQLAQAHGLPIDPSYLDPSYHYRQAESVPGGLDGLLKGALPISSSAGLPASSSVVSSSNPSLSNIAWTASQPLLPYVSNTLVGLAQTDIYNTAVLTARAMLANAQLASAPSYQSASYQYSAPRSQQAPTANSWAALLIALMDSSGLAPAAVLPGLSINTPGDEDWFHFDLAQAGRADDFVRIGYETSRGLLQLALYVKTPEGTLLQIEEASTFTGAEEISLDRLPAGSYYVRVCGWADATNPDYQLEFSLQQAPQDVRPDWSEPANSRTAARDLRTIEGTRTFAGLNLHAAGDEDWFSFTTSATALPDDFVDVRFNEHYADVDVELYDGSGVLLASSTGQTGVEHLPLKRASDGTLLPAGTYFVRVFGHAGTTSPAYALTIASAGSTLPADVFESNDTRDLATNLMSFHGLRQLSDLTIRAAQGATPADVDYFRFTTTNTGRDSDRLQIDFDAARGDLQIQLYNSAGTLVTRPGATSTEIPLSGLAAGTYYAKVSGTSSTLSNKYTLNFELPPRTSATTQDEWTLFVYMTAGDLAKYAAQDVNELEQAAAQLPPSVNIVVLLDQSPGESFATGRGTQPAWTGAGQAVIQPDLDTDVITTRFQPAVSGASSLNTDINSGSAQTLRDFLVWGVQQAPAKRYGLIFWNHGEAFRGSNLDTDDGPTDHLQISEMVSGISAAKSQAAFNLELISFDACQMQTLEVVHALGAVAPIVVGSEELETSEGSNYASAFARLAQNPGAVMGQHLAAALVQDYGARNRGDVHGADTLSAAGTAWTLMNPLAASLKAFTDAVAAVPVGDPAETALRTTILAARDAASAFSRRSDLRDLRQFLANVVEKSTVHPSLLAVRNAAAAVLPMLDAVVQAKTLDRRAVGGLSIYWPGPTETLDPAYLAEFAPFLSATGWGTLLERFRGPATTTVETQSDWAEANDTFSRAYHLGDVIGAGNVWTGLNLHTATDTDWFRFRLPKGGDATSFLRLAAAPGMSLAVALSSASAPLTTLKTASLVNGIASLSLNGFAAGEYLIKVTSPTASPVDRYWLTMTAPAAFAGEVIASDAAGNQSREKARDLGTIPSSAVMSGLGVTAGTTDWYAFTTPRSQTNAASSEGSLSIRIPGQTSMQASLWTEQGTLVVTKSGTGQLDFIYDASGALKYYVSVTPSASETSAAPRPYALQFASQALARPQLDLALDRTSIAAGGVTRLTVARIDAPLDEPLVVTLTASPGGYLHVPLQVTIPAGARQINVNLTAVTPFPGNSAASISLTAANAGFQATTVGLRVDPIPPIIGGITSPQGYTENGAAKLLAPSATVADPDSANFAGGTLTAKYTAGGLGSDRLTIRHQGSGAGQVGVSGDTLSVGGIVVGTFVGGSGQQPLVITFNTDAGPLRVQALLRSIQYHNVSDNPTNFGAGPSRTVNYVLTDGDGGTSAAVNQTLNITASNDRPVLGAISSPQTYKENGAAKLLAPLATVADPDSANFGGGKLAVKYTAGGLGSDRLTIRHQGTGPGQVGVSGNTLSVGGVVVGTFAGGTGLQPLVVTFNADAKPLRVQAVLRTLQYQNISDNPTNFGANPSRTVNYVLTDGDGGTSVAVNQTLNITAVNDASVIGNFTDASTYTAGAAATILDANATLTDLDSAAFAGGNLVLMLSAGGVATNRLAIRNQGTGTGQIGVSDSDVTFAGTVIGTLNANGGIGLNALIVTFTPDATPAAVQALLRNLTYRSTAANPIGPKTLTLKVRDGDGGLTTVNKTLNIAPALVAAQRSSAAFASYAEWESAL